MNCRSLRLPNEVKTKFEKLSDHLKFSNILDHFRMIFESINDLIFPCRLPKFFHKHTTYLNQLLIMSQNVCRLIFPLAATNILFETESICPISLESTHQSSENSS